MLKPLKSSEWNAAKAAHLLNRAGFCAHPEEVERLAAMSPGEAVASLVDYEKTPDPVTRPEWARPNPDAFKEQMAMRLLSEEEKRQQRRRLRRQNRNEMTDLRQWWLERMAYGPRPLQEKLVLFWHGHFATSQEKVRNAFYMYRQNEVFRQHAKGPWLEMLTAVSKDPAMLLWLDGARSNRKHPNENFAREVMELFALGEGHYSEDDIREAARAFTGWSIDRGKQDYVWRQRAHDAGSKTFFGQRGKFKGEDILAMIVDQPQADRHLTARLWRFFASEQISPQLDNALAMSFRYHDKTVGPFLREVFLSREFYAPEVMNRQVKSPTQWLVSTIRLLNRELPPPAVNEGILRQLGQELFRPPNVKGWDGGVAWIDTNRLLARYNFAKDLVEGRRGGSRPSRQFTMDALTRGEPKAREAMMERLMNSQLGRMAPADIAKLLPAYRDLPPAEILAKLEEHFIFTRLKPARRETLLSFLNQQKRLDETSLRHAIRLLMCTPEYQLT
ncbi:MAG: DUF1800 domain-containing protein [Verrucomicrobiota bacterium]